MVKHKETESESEGSSHAEEPRFRISVCMERFYSDERARAYVSVSARRRVRWLQSRLRRLFELPPAFRLLSRGHLLPPDEPLALLQPDDPVDVVPVHETATARDVVDTAENVASEQFERSPSPISSDLTETKRKALLMLEQYSTQAEDTVRPRRRRVRRRRRVPERSRTDDEPAPAPASVFRGPEGEAMVLRNELIPRAPRVVRPLCDLMPAEGLLTPPSEIFT